MEAAQVMCQSTEAACQCPRGLVSTRGSRGGQGGEQCGGGETGAGRVFISSWSWLPSASAKHQEAAAPWEPACRQQEKNTQDRTRCGPVGDRQPSMQQTVL